MLIGDFVRRNSGENIHVVKKGSTNIKNACMESPFFFVLSHMLRKSDAFRREDDFACKSEWKDFAQASKIEYVGVGVCVIGAAVSLHRAVFHIWVRGALLFVRCVDANVLLCQFSTYTRKYDFQNVGICIPYTFLESQLLWRC